MNAGSHAAFDLALAIRVVPGCQDGAVGAQAECVGGARRDRDNVSPVTRVALTVFVGPDGIDPTVRPDTDGVVAARAHGDDIDPSSHIALRRGPTSCRHDGAALRETDGVQVARGDSCQPSPVADFALAAAMVNQYGSRIASANHVGRTNWTVEADGRTYEFRRGSLWREEEELCSEGRRVGSVKRTSIWRGDAVADLPGLPPSVEVFVLAVVLTEWDSA